LLQSRCGTHHDDASPSSQGTASPSGLYNFAGNAHRVNQFVTGFNKLPMDDSPHRNIAEQDKRDSAPNHSESISVVGQQALYDIKLGQLHRSAAREESLGDGIKEANAMLSGPATQDHNTLEMLEIPQDLAVEESRDKVVTEMERWKNAFAFKPIVAPRAFQWHAREVKASHAMLLNLTNADMELLASFERPPLIVERVIMAVHDLLGMPNHSWLSMRRMLSVELRDPYQEGSKLRPHQQFQAALAECALHPNWYSPIYSYDVKTSKLEIYFYLRLSILSIHVHVHVNT